MKNVPNFLNKVGSRDRSLLFSKLLMWSDINLAINENTYTYSQASQDRFKNTYIEVTVTGAPRREVEKLEQPLCEKMSHWYFLSFINVKFFLSCGGEAEF